MTFLYRLLVAIQADTTQALASFSDQLTEPERRVLRATERGVADMLEARKNQASAPGPRRPRSE